MLSSTDGAGGEEGEGVVARKKHEERVRQFSTGEKSNSITFSAIGVITTVGKSLVWSEAVKVILFSLSSGCSSELCW